WCFSTTQTEQYQRFFAQANLAEIQALLSSNRAHYCQSSSHDRSLLAQQNPTDKQAALVIDFGDGQVLTYCIELGDATNITGIDLLQATGLDLALEYTPGLGSAVCRIGD